MIVPAVTEVSFPQAAHSQLARRRFSSQPLSWPQAGQTKPSGQRLAARCRAQEASSGKRASKAARDMGRSYFQRLAITKHYTNMLPTPTRNSTSRQTGLKGISRHSLPSTSRRSIRPRVVGTSNTALAMKARASAARSSSGRPLAAEVGQKSLDPHQFQNRDEQLVALAHRAKLALEPGNSRTSNPSISRKRLHSSVVIMRCFATQSGGLARSYVIVGSVTKYEGCSSAFAAQRSPVFCKSTVVHGF